MPRLGPEIPDDRDWKAADEVRLVVQVIPGDVDPDVTFKVTGPHGTTTHKPLLEDALGGEKEGIFDFPVQVSGPHGYACQATGVSRLVVHGARRNLGP